MNVAIIGGTGIYSVDGIGTEKITVDTEFGPALLYHGLGEHSRLYFISRHGTDHSVPPHKVNYRANIAALAQLEVKRAVGIYAVGSITEKVRPGTIGLMDQFIDMTQGREFTFFNGGSSGLLHREMAEPCCRDLGKRILEIAAERGLVVADGGTYICCNGPRFETAAEIRMYRGWGADFSGMTAATEISLAREKGIHIAGLVYSINWAAGVRKDLEFITREDVAEKKRQMLELAVETLFSVPGTCGCDYQPEF